MAAAALSRSRGVAGVRTTRGLFFIFTLLCLVCLASSLIDKNQLEKLKETLQKAKQDTDSLKAERKAASELMSYYMSSMDLLIALAKKTSDALPHDFPPVEGLLENIKGFVEKTKAFIDGQNEGFGAKIENAEQKLREIKKLVKFLEEHQAEL